MIYRKRNGFTLIELLVASTIMIILTAIGLVSFASSGRSARNSKRKADMETVRQALVLYRSDNGGYPDDTTYDAMVTELMNTNYLSAPSPQDPKNTDSYVYEYSPTGVSGGLATGFCLCALTEGTDQGNSSGACNFVVGAYHCVENP